MAKIVIDGKEYELESLSKEVQTQVANIQFVERKIAELQSEIAVMNAAKQYYLALLKAHLPQEDTIQYDKE